LTMDMNEIARLITTLRDDMNSRFDQMELSMHETKIELDAKIDSKIDKVRFEIVDLSSNIENRFTILTEQVDSKLLEINYKIDNNKNSTDAFIANISNEVYEINEKFNRFLLLDFDQRVEEAIKPTVNQMREAQQNVLETMEGVTQAMDELVKRETVTPKEMHEYFSTLEADIHEIKQQTYQTQLELSQAKEEVANLDKSIVKNVSDISARVDKIKLLPPKDEHSEEIGNWLKIAAEANESARNYSLSALQKESADTPKKSSKKSKSKHGRKKAVKISDDEPDPGDSPPGSSGSENESPTGSDTSDTEKSKKKKKKKDFLDPDKFRPGGRRTSILGDPEEYRPPPQQYYPYLADRSAPTLSLQPHPTTSDLYLDKVRIDSVLAFCKKFNEESVRFVLGLKVSSYLSDQVRSQLKQLAIKHNLPGKDGIIRGGVQTVTNEEVFALLSRMCAPKTIQAMQCELLKPCFPSKNSKLYTDGKSILKNIADYKYDISTYIDRFEDRLKLLGYTEEANKFIPKYLFKKGGQAGDMGLADYFIHGLPKHEFALRTWISVLEKDRLQCKDWATFVKLYSQALEVIEENENTRKVNEAISIGVKEMVKAERAERDALREARMGKRPQNLHAVRDTYMDTVISDGSDTSELPISDVDEGELPSAIEHGDEENEYADEGDAPYSPARTQQNLEESDLQQVAEAYGTCYEMANTGKCTRPNCKYSHKPEDIEKLKKLRAARQAQGKGHHAKQVNVTKPAAFAPRKA